MIGLAERLVREKKEYRESKWECLRGGKRIIIIQERNVIDKKKIQERNDLANIVLTRIIMIQERHDRANIVRSHFYRSNITK
jgi:hypothetical protein